MPEKACLVMILLNESENVLKALRSVEGLWSRFVILFDRATTDDTEILVRQYMAGREHLGIFDTFTWPNSFAAARNMVLDRARACWPECAYALSLDGDDVLAPYSRPVVQSWLQHPQPAFLCLNSYVHLDPDAYGIPFLVYPRPCVLQNTPEVRYEFAAHNVLQCPAGAQLLVQNLVVIHNQAPKKRQMREQQRIAHNIPNLQVQASSMPEESRPLFYLGNSLLDAGRYADAEAAYLKYLELSTWPDERYQTMLHLAALRFQAQDLAGAERWLWEALRVPGQWNRAEAYMHLSDCALAGGRLAEAMHWCGIAGEMPPPVTSLFLQGAIYTYLPHWRLTLLFDRLGFYDKALEHARRACAWRPSPDIKAAVAVLEQLVRDGVNRAPSGIMPMTQAPELPIATQIMPLPQEELERLLAEIPVPVEVA